MVCETNGFSQTWSLYTILKPFFWVFQKETFTVHSDILNLKPKYVKEIKMEN